MRGRCRSCGKEVYWAVTATGGSMPVDPDPVEDGNVLLATRQRPFRMVATVMKKDEEIEEGRRRFVSHFTSCPEAGKWRRR